MGDGSGRASLLFLLRTLSHSLALVRTLSHFFNSRAGVAAGEALGQSI